MITIITKRFCGIKELVKCIYRIVDRKLNVLELSQDNNNVRTSLVGSVFWGYISRHRNLTNGFLYSTTSEEFFLVLRLY